MQAAVNLSRRGFFRAKVTTPSVLRPPWAIAEEAFLASCTRCNDCITACPTHILCRGDGGFPEVDFTHGECTFCRSCLTACVAGALQSKPDAAPWQARATIDAACLALKNVVCRTCGDVCEPGAIRFRPQVGRAAQPEVDAERCSGCGACLAPCPSHAVSVAAHNHGVFT